MNEVKGWRYYNHAMVPTTAPHEKAIIKPLLNGKLWNYNKMKPLLIVWTSHWDCSFETNWWYVIREGPFRLDDLSASSRRNIRKALRNCRVEIINPGMYIEELWQVYNEAIQRYKNYATDITKDEFIRFITNKTDEEEYWAGFDNSTGLMVGYAIFVVHNDWVMFHKSRYSTPYLRLRVSDAINARALEYYLNEKEKKYVSDGMRSILHKTNFQQYLMDHFGYRKAYCKLHVEYRKVLKICIKILFHFKEKLLRLDHYTKIHQLNSLLYLEEIVRSEHD